MTRKLIYSSICVIVLLSGCSKDEDGENVPQVPSPSPSAVPSPSPSVVPSPSPSVVPKNKAPIVDAGIDKTVIVNNTVLITGKASDTDGTISSIEWKKDNEVLATTLVFSYIPTVIGTDKLTLTVMDDDAESTSDSVTIVITENNNNNDSEEP